MIAYKVRKTIKSKLGLRNDVTDDMTLAIDLGCDELDMVETIMELEKVLHFQMPGDMLECFDPMGTMTVADLIRAVEDSAPVRLFDNKIPLTLVLIILFYIIDEVKDLRKKDNIAHYGHIAGAICGGVFGFLCVNQAFMETFRNIINTVVG